jgi:hypothetical protein
MDWNQYVPNPMRSGYAYELSSSKGWRSAPNDDWDTVILSESDFRGAKLLGTRHIDGVQMRVYRKGSRTFAQTMAYTEA